MTAGEFVDTVTERRRLHATHVHRSTIDALYAAVRDGAMSWQLATLVADVIGPGAWRIEAACQGKPVEWFYPKVGKTTADAVAVCAVCPVRDECLAYADVCERAGIWGGVSAYSRRRADPNRACEVCGVRIGRTLRRFCDPCRTERRTAQQSASRVRTGHAAPRIGSA